MTETTSTNATIQQLSSALPFWLSVGLLPVVYLAASLGGWWLTLIPLSSWGLFSVLDRLFGLETSNENPDTPDSELFWHRLITLIWLPLQLAVIFTAIWYVGTVDYSLGEKLGLFFGVGVLTGMIGINYAHELMHQKNRLERLLADLLLASVLYSHFRSEHLLVHHRYVATPKDPATARYNEHFYHFFPRVLRQSLLSSWRAEAAMLARKNLPALHGSNPFALYALLQIIMLAAAYLVGGWAGVGLFAFQALVAVWQLELVNYVEHYGLTRRHLGDGRYEHVQPRHSWNAAQKVSNWMLINLQRHSDHHYKPDRRFPLLQNYTEADAPQLPFGYAVMTLAAMVPPLFRRLMNPRVRKWRAMYYPDIVDWTDYKTASTPMPR